MITRYLTVGVTDRAGFIRKVPTNSTELAHILPHLSTSPADPVLVRRVQCAIPEEFSGRWVLIHVRGDSHGVISIYINKELSMCSLLLLFFFFSSFSSLLLFFSSSFLLLCASTHGLYRGSNFIFGYFCPPSILAPRNQLHWS